MGGDIRAAHANEEQAKFIFSTNSEWSVSKVSYS